MMWQVASLFCVVLAFTPSTQVPTQNTDENVVEVYFVVDRKAIAIYEAESTETTSAAKLTDAKAKMELDIDYFITEVNKLYQSLAFFPSYGLNIKIAKRKLDFLDNDVFASNIIETANLVAAQKSLDSFEAHLNAGGAYGTINYDLALLWTGYDLYNTSALTTGFAYIGTVCSGSKAISVVEFNGTYTTVSSTAHEIAHNLGASHDSRSTGYVMAGQTVYNSENRWSFSLCSVSDIGAVIGGLSPNCLLTTDPASVIPNAGITATLMNPNSFCKRSTGDANSHVCTSHTFYGGQAPAGDDVCTMLACYRGNNKCGFYMTPDGLICGEGKSCNKGECVADPRPEAQGVDETCLFGDQQTVNFFGSDTTCGAVLDVQPLYCHQSIVEQRCCAYCDHLNTGIPGCEWGDRNRACSYYTPTARFCAVNGVVCCETCHNAKRKRSTSDDDNGGSVVLPPEAEKMIMPFLEETDSDPKDKQSDDPHSPQA